MSHPFSQRIGAVKVPEMLQLNDMTRELRISLWNVLLPMVQELNVCDEVVRGLAIDVLDFPLHDLPVPRGQAMWLANQETWLANQFFMAPWYTVYDIVEYFVTTVVEPRMQAGYAELFNKSLGLFNKSLERQHSGYRFVAGRLAPITSPAELAAIQEAIDAAERTGLGAVRTHIASAIELLGERPDPDYRNSIKESISAVEAAAALIAGSGKRDLEGALSRIEQRSAPLHGAFKAALIKLYAYTSDEGGIRHALLDEPNVGFDEAKFMLVACSAFGHYLIAKAEGAGLLPARR